MDYAYVLAGLGNPGSQYDGTRHNCGFLLVDALCRKAEAEGRLQTMNGSKFSCELLRVDLPELRGPWLVAKPQTFMNLSGQSVQPLLAWHKIPPNRLVVAHDELDIPAGSKIVVTQEGRTNEYQKSGEPAVYSFHQEVMLVPFERYA